MEQETFQEVTSLESSTHENLIDELRNIHQTQSKFGSISLFLVTIIVFFSAGIITTRLQEIIILIAVLFLHETGHFITMKLLKYHDVKMFFIPFLGAAVSGKAQKETALKSCIVSVMGPLPGIIIGTILYLLFALTNNYYILKTAQVMLLLNAFNFLPIMPLDGGRCIDVLFINRRVLRLLFALFGAACFLILALLSHDFFLGFIGVFSLISAFTNFRIHGIAGAIKSKGITALSVDELLDNREQIEVVIEELKKKSASLFTPKIIHRAIYNNLTVIIDTVKFIPATLFTKALLLVFYPIILLLSLIATTFFIAANFQENRTIITENNREVTVADRYMFGKLKNRIPFNNALQYHGKGIVFGDDTIKITDIIHFNNGYRTGTWVTFNESGDTIQMDIYENGKLLYTINKNETANDTLSTDEFSFLKKIGTQIREMAQPLRTNYEYFE